MRTTWSKTVDNGRTAGDDSVCPLCGDADAMFWIDWKTGAITCIECRGVAGFAKLPRLAERPRSCAHCRRAFYVNIEGRPRRYCSVACKAVAERERRKERR